MLENVGGHSSEDAILPWYKLLQDYDKFNADGEITNDELKELNSKYKDKFEAIKSGSVWEYKKMLRGFPEYQLLKSYIDWFESSNKLRREEVMLLQRKFNLEEDWIFGLGMFATFIQKHNETELYEFMENHIRLIPKDTSLFDALKIIPWEWYEINKKDLLNTSSKFDLQVKRWDVVKVKNDFTTIMIERDWDKLMSFEVSADFDSTKNKLLQLSENSQEEALSYLINELHGMPDYKARFDYVSQMLSSYSESELRKIFLQQEWNGFKINFADYQLFNQLVSANHLFLTMSELSDWDNVYEFEWEDFIHTSTKAKLFIKDGDVIYPYVNKNKELLEERHLNFEAHFGKYIDWISHWLKISPDVIKALIKVESNEDIHERNKTSLAQWLMQLTSKPFNDMEQTHKKGTYYGRGVSRYLPKFKSVFADSSLLEQIGDTRAKQAITDILSMEKNDRDYFAERISILRDIIRSEHETPDPYLNIAIGSIYYSIESQGFDERDDKNMKRVIKKLDIDLDTMNKFLDNKGYDKITKQDISDLKEKLLKPENEELRKTYFSLTRFNWDTDKYHFYDNKKRGIDYKYYYAIKVLLVQGLTA